MEVLPTCPPQKISPLTRQSLVALGPILITVSLGMTEGYSAILLPQLSSGGPLDAGLASWIASMAALPMSLGCLLGGIMMERIGRKAIHMWACAPCLLGWLLIYFSDGNTRWLLIGRFVAGFSVGLLGPPTGVYISETSSPHLRGLLLAAISFAIALGIFLSHLIGTITTWQNTALSACAFPVISVVLMVFTPESPTFLAKKGRVREAELAFRWCRGWSTQATNELHVLITRQQLLNSQEISFRKNLKTLNTPEFLKPLAIIVIFFVTCQWAGLNAVTFYSISIIEGALNGGHFNKYTAMLIIDTIRVIMSLFSCFLTRKIGRRPLAITSSVGTALSLFVLSAYPMATRYFRELNHPAIPLVALVFYVTFITIGLVPLPWTMMAEVFPLANRGIGSGLAALASYSAFFSVVKSTPMMLEDWGAQATFLLYGLIAAIGSVFLGIFLPETKDKALFEIEDRFKE